MIQCKTFEDLQALGTEKIHERTHISRDKLELVLTKSYGEIGRYNSWVLCRFWNVNTGSILQK